MGRGAGSLLWDYGISEDLNFTVKAGLAESTSVVGEEYFPHSLQNIPARKSCSSFKTWLSHTGSLLNYFLRFIAVLYWVRRKIRSVKRSFWSFQDRSPLDKGQGDSSPRDFCAFGRAGGFLPEGCETEDSDAAAGISVRLAEQQRASVCPPRWGWCNQLQLKATVI